MTTRFEPRGVALEATFRVEAALEDYAPGEKDGPPTFDMVANTGSPMWVVGWPTPVVVDLGGIAGTDRTRPILKDHSASMVVGHSTEFALEGGSLVVRGVISGTSQVTKDVVGAARNGFPWQASIGIDVLEVEEVDDGEAVTVNGRTYAGPLTVARSSKIREVSVVAMGADDATSTSIAANAAGGDIVGDTMKPGAGKASEAAAEAGAEIKAGADAVADYRMSVAAEARRVAEIQRVAAGYPDVVAEAVEGGWSAEKTENAVLRRKVAEVEARVDEAPAGFVASGRRSGDPKVLEAALYIAAGGRDAAKTYGEEAANRADDQFRGQFSLGEFLLDCAGRGGYAGRQVVNQSTVRPILEAAFSYADTPGILSNVQNKILVDAFDAVEASWGEIAATMPLPNFKPASMYRMTGDLAFQKVGESGEIRNGTLGEATYSLKADDYAIRYSLTRQQIIDDDLGAFNEIPRRMGRGAALAVNRVFWNEFTDNASFFTGGRNNLETGATSALDIDGLALAAQTFREQTDEDGNPLGSSPRILLVPPSLETMALQLFRSTNIDGTGAGNGNANVFAGRFRPVVSNYLTDATEWYLLADPQDIATMAVGFLGGQRTPTVESADADFGTLGIQFRGYFGFGVAKHEFRGGVKMAGE